MEKYLKYYFLEQYLFDTVNKNFHENNYLTREEFLAIVIWKRRASITKVIDGIRSSGKTVKTITNEIYNSANNKEEQLRILCRIKNIGIAIASAILTVLYPDKFTIIDYRAKHSLKKLKIPIQGSPANRVEDYFNYVKICNEHRKKYNLTLRDFDRALWTMDFYAGENGVKEYAEKLN